MASADPPRIVKVGGSLFDLPDLAARLRPFCQGDVLLVPGGGPLAECVRRYDAIYHLGEEACHWLALRAVSVNAHVLAQLLPAARIISDLNLRSDGLAILDGYEFAVANDAHPDRLPHSWAATSDSLALRVAIIAKARELVLLKSTDLPEGIDWSEAARRGLVDEYFWRIVPAHLPIRVVNLRK